MYPLPWLLELIVLLNLLLKEWNTLGILSNFLHLLVATKFEIDGWFELYVNLLYSAMRRLYFWVRKNL